jgi:hypothetical protein
MGVHKATAKDIRLTSSATERLIWNFIKFIPECVFLACGVLPWGSQRIALFGVDWIYHFYETQSRSVLEEGVSKKRAWTRICSNENAR